MVYNVDQDNNDEYKATVPSAFTVGGGTLVIDFAIRYLPPGVVGADYLYDVAVTDQENAEAPLSYPITGDAPPQIQAGDLLFTEVMQNPTGVGDDTGEYFEIYNTTDGAIDVEGWTVKSANDADFVISNGGNSVVVAAGTYFVFVRHVDALGTESVPYFSYEKSFNLGNSSDDLALVTPAGLTVDSVAWDNGATFPDPAGASMQLHNDPSVMTHEANDLGTNWCTATVAFSTGDAGSPGAANEACP